MGAIDPAAWSPARSGTAIGKLVSFVLVRKAGPPAATTGARSQQRWQNRWELLTASAIWCLLPPALAASLIAPGLSVIPRTALWIAVPVLAPVLVQISIFVVGGLVVLMRRAGLLRKVRDGVMQLAAWGGTASILAVVALRHAGPGRALAILWFALLGGEALAAFVVLLLRKRIAAVELPLGGNR